MSIEADPRESHPPVYWFVILTAALERGDYRTAQQAADRLRESGIAVSVRFPRELEAVDA